MFVMSTITFVLLLFFSFQFFFITQLNILFLILLFNNLVGYLLSSRFLEVSLSEHQPVFVSKLASD